MTRLLQVVLFVSLCAVVTTSDTCGQTISNGSLTGTASEGNVPAGWSQYAGNSSDTADSAGPFGTYVLSPDGGTFVRSFSWQRDTSPSLFNQREGLVQSVSGFAIGQRYEVSFYQSSVNGINSLTGAPFSGAPGQWTLLVDDLMTDVSDLMAPPAGVSLENTWTGQNFSFAATSNSHVLSFLATVPDAAPVNTRTFMAIDGISIRVIPEPSTCLLALMAISVPLLRHRF